MPDPSKPDGISSHDPLSPPSNATASQFPSSNLARFHLSEDSLEAPDAASALATINPDSDMESLAGGSGHRRRRSSLMNSSDTNQRASSRRRSTHSVASDTRRLGISEEAKLGTGKDGIEEEISDSDDVELDDLSDDGLQDDEETGLTGKDRRKRKRRKRKNTLLDERIAGAIETTAGDKKEADKSVVRNLLINGLFIVLWYIFSLSISIYNKWMFSPDHLDFHFPLFTTCGHMLVQFTLAGLVLLLLPQFRPRYDSISNPHNTHAADSDSAQHETENKKPLMTKAFYLTRIGPCGMATGLDIGLGNMSLKFITLTFYTMCKSSSLAFVLLFAFVFRLETPSWRLVAIIATMTVGVIMMVAGEVSFSILGFILVISAAFFSGFRWGLTQILLLRNPATSNPFSSIFYLAPVMFTSLFIIAVPVEGFPALWQGLGILVEKKGPILGPLILLFPGIIAFLMTSSEFALLQRTSVVTLSIAGIFKEVVTISAAGIVFGDPLTPINISGLVVTIGAICAYNYIKIKKMREEALKDVVQHHALTQEESDGGEDEDWNREGNTYVTADGEILPLPGGSSYGRREKGKNSKGGAEVDAQQQSLLGNADVSVDTPGRS